MKKLIVMLALVILAGCTKPAEKAHQVNTNFKVETLFTHDGCTVYRFEDGRVHYFTDCSGSTSTTASCGKGCTYVDGIAGGKP